MLYKIHLNVSLFILKYNKTALLSAYFVKFILYLQMITEKYLVRTTVGSSGSIVSDYRLDDRDSIPGRDR
jgi:hypothetical protein